MILDPSKTLLTVKEVAERLRVCPATAYELIRQGKIRSLRVGTNRGVIRVRELDVEEYLSAGTQQVAQPNQLLPPVRIRLKHLRLK
jgi:excisionase family DNA binding protein